LVSRISCGMKHSEQPSTFARSTISQLHTVCGDPLNVDLDCRFLAGGVEKGAGHLG